jgi:hypothetical protein
VLRPCSRGDRVLRSLFGNTTRLRIGATVGGQAAPALVEKRKATPSDSKIVVLQPCSRGERESIPPSGNTQRIRIGATVNGHAAPAPTPSDSKPALLQPYNGSEDGCMLVLEIERPKLRRRGTQARKGWRGGGDHHRASPRLLWDQRWIEVLTAVAGDRWIV